MQLLLRFVFLKFLKSCSLNRSFNKCSSCNLDKEEVADFQTEALLYPRRAGSIDRQVLLRRHRNVKCKRQKGGVSKCGLSYGIKCHVLHIINAH